MSVRVVIGLTAAAASAWSETRPRLRAAGATQMTDPRPELPDAIIATFDDEASAKAFIARAAGQFGVRYAEPDGWSFTQESIG